MKQSLLESCSLEVTAKQAMDMAAVAHRFPAGMQVAVACLPGESNAERARAVVALRGLGFEPVPHIAARLLASSGELASTLAQYAAEANVSRLFVIAGDLDHARGPHADALSVIRSGQLERQGIREVGIAGYPEGHPKIIDAVLAQALQDKHREILERGMDCEITTQFGFDAHAAVDWIARVRASDIAAPIRLGIAGPASTGTLLKYAAVCGVRTSAKVLAKYGLSLTKLLHPGGPDDYIGTLVQELQPAHGEVTLHLYPFGGLSKTADWWTRTVVAAEPSNH
ncbi:MAG TPA: methylenetetrahydrofolate reductase [Ramlibacter sp.]|jgi:methylenetetrahydrofolate reductase (NADPH)|nr:methylenetetrahydrofolate reductase [Ramlibacter sp.]